MSTYEQISLFSGNYKSEQEEQVVAPRIFKSSTSATILPKAKRLAALYDIEPGSILYTNSIHRPVKLLVLKNENSKITCRKMFEKEQYVPNRQEAEAPFELNVEENLLLGVAQSDGLYFFSQNKSKPLHKVSANLFANYVNEYFRSGRTNDLLIFRAMFSHFIDTTTNIYKNSNPFISAFRSAKYNSNYGLPIGYWDNQLTMDYEHQGDIWSFNCFGTELSLNEEEALEAYKNFIKVFNDEFDLKSFSDLHLVAFYKFQGYDVRLNFLTFEWTIKQAASTKSMYIEREELLDSKALIEKWTNFATLKNVSGPKIPRGANFERFIDRHIPSTPLKAFSIPANTTLHSEALYNLTGHRHFVVVEDLGKQVRLAPIDFVYGETSRDEPSFKIKENEKEVVMPRTHINSATLFDSNNKKSLCKIPYGIPNDLDNSAEALMDTIANYPNTLTKLELKQIVAFDVIRNKHSVIQAIKEKDLKVAVAQLKNDLSLGVSSLIPGLHNKFESKGIVLDSFRSEFTQTFSYTEIVEAYWAMLLIIERFDMSELSLGELMLFYYSEGLNLSLTSVPFFFYFEGKGFHTSKYNPTDYQAMNSLLHK